MNEVHLTLNAFLEATREVLETLSIFDLELKQHTEVDSVESDLLAVTACLPLLRGDVADRLFVLTLSRPLARVVVATMLGIDEDEIDADEDLLDGIGEVGNMVAGIAKLKVDGTAQAFSLSLPVTRSNREPTPVPELPLTGGFGAWCTVGGEPLRVTLFWNDF